MELVRQRFKLAMLVVVALLVTLSVRFNVSLRRDASPKHRDTIQITEFDWSSLTPARQLYYTPCPHRVNQNYQCAKLIVPLDYANDTDSRTAVLAIMKLPAPVDVTSPRYGGAFLAHPGGPGASGQDYFTLFDGKFARYMQRATSDLADLDGAQGVAAVCDQSHNSSRGQVFDIITLDPRGVGASRPLIRDFSSCLAQQKWKFAEGKLGVQMQDDAVLTAHLARQKAYGFLLREAFERDDGVGKYVGTVSTVHDLLALGEAHAEWREREAQQVLSSPQCRLALSEEDIESITARTRNRGKEERLNIWGSSYSSVVAQYFATLFPERYNRMIIEGVVDPNEWIGGWSIPPISSVEAITRVFAKECYAAGPILCSLWDRSGPGATVSNIYAFLDKLRLEGPLAGIVNGEPVTASVSDFTLMLLSKYYAAQTEFKNVDKVLSSAMKGDLGPISAESVQITCSADSSSSDDCVSAMRAIQCLDVDPEIWHNYTDTMNVKALRDKAIAESPVFGGALFTFFNRLSCPSALEEVSVSRHLRYLGPFGHHSIAAAATGGSSGTEDHSTRAILFASSAHDPVTPLEGARSARKLFPGSGLLVSGGTGHCTKTWMSECTESKIRAYVRTGLVDPDDEDWCEQEGNADWTKQAASSPGTVGTSAFEGKVSFI